MFLNGLHILALSPILDIFSNSLTNYDLKWILFQYGWKILVCVVILFEKPQFLERFLVFFFFVFGLFSSLGGQYWRKKNKLRKISFIFIGYWNYLAPIFLLFNAFRKILISVLAIYDGQIFVKISIRIFTSIFWFLPPIRPVAIYILFREFTLWMRYSWSF